MDNHNTTIDNCSSIQLRCPIMANDLADAIHQHLIAIRLQEMSTNSALAIAKLEAIANALAGR